MKTPTPPATGERLLNSPQHTKVRRFLRIAGPVILIIGVIFTAAAFISLVSAMGAHSGPPKLFWCGFVGLPLIFVGTVMCGCGFMGAMARYAAAEQAPVAADTVNYLAENTQQGVKTVSKAIAQGVAEGMRETEAKDHTSKD